jgi:hypothetical protein
MITALVIASVLVGAAPSAGIEFVDCHEPGSCQALGGTRVPPDRQHRALFAAGVTSYIDADLKLPDDSRHLPDALSPDDPVYVVTSPHIPLIQGLKVAAVPSVAAAEALARRKGRRVVVAEFKLTEAFYGPERGPAVDVIISSGTVVPQPRTTSPRPQWKYVSHGFDAYHVYRKRDGQIVFQLQARAAD